MASTSIKIVAPRQLVAAVKWVGGDAAYGLIKHWARGSVERNSEGELYLQTEEGVELVPIGNYILLVGDYFHVFTPEEYESDYVEVLIKD